MTGPDLPLLIVVSGAPGSGKTTIGKRLAAELRLPFISKDIIKESLFDTLGTADRDWSRKLGLASTVLLFRLVEIQLQAGQSVVAESNFYWNFDASRLSDLRSRYQFRLLHIYCKADSDVLISRFQRRARSEERHPGHVEGINISHIIEEIRTNLLKGVWDPTGVGGEVLTVDTTDFEKLDYSGLMQAIRRLEASSPPPDPPPQGWNLRPPKRGAFSLSQWEI